MYYIDEIDNLKLTIFFDFILSKCKKISFKRLYQRGSIEKLDPNVNIEMFYEIGFIEKNEFNIMQKTMKKVIHDSCAEIESRTSDVEFKKAYEEELETYGWYIDYDKEIKNKKDLSFKCESDEYLGNEITRCSYDTIGVFQEICYFTIGKIAKDVISQMNNFYDWEKYNVCNEQFNSLACWRNNEEVIFYTMPGDKAAILNLTDDEYKELFELNIGIKLSK